MVAGVELPAPPSNLDPPVTNGERDGISRAIFEPGRLVVLGGDRHEVDLHCNGTFTCVTRQHSDTGNEDFWELTRQFREAAA